jgi:hypothetical protein
MSSIVAEQICETATREIPQIVWAEFTSLIVPVYSSVGSQPPYEIHLPVSAIFPGLIQCFHFFNIDCDNYLLSTLHKYCVVSTIDLLL